LSSVRAHLPGLPVLVAEVVDLAGLLYIVSSVRSGWSCLFFLGTCVRAFLVSSF
jgi:hypothetical protein